jgi:putative transposase
MVAAAIRTTFTQPDAAHVREQLGVIAGMLGRQSVEVETRLRDAAEDLLAFTDTRPRTERRSGRRTRSSA